MTTNTAAVALDEDQQLGITVFDIQNGKTVRPGRSIDGINIARVVFALSEEGSFRTIIHKAL